MAKQIKARGSLVCFMGLIALGGSVGSASLIIPTNFNGYGTKVNGYQDFFTGTTFNSSWTEIANAGVVTTGSSGNFTLPGDGTLHVNGGGGDPNKLLYNGPAYDSANQSVLAMIEVTGGADTDGFRGGVGTVSSATNGQGINELFRQSGNGGDTNPTSNNHMNFLDDAKAWGPLVGGASSWNTGTFYWLRLTTTGTSAGATTETAEMWPADGTTPESAASTATWNEATGRTGLAGIIADSGGNGTFQVNYALVQAAGLPNITVGIAPEPASVGLFAVSSLGLLGRHRRRV